MFDLNQKPVLDYPCPWEYKVIGEDEFAMRRAIDEVFSELEYEVSYSHASRTGRYCSLLIALTVVNEQQRVALFTSLKAHQDIRMVL